MIAKKRVWGMRERGGRTKAMPVNNTRAKILQHVIENHIEKGSKIYAGDGRNCQTPSKLDYDHQALKYSAKKYANRVIFRLNDGSVERHLMDRISDICVHAVGCRITCKDLKNDQS